MILNNILWQHKQLGLLVIFSLIMTFSGFVVLPFVAYYFDKILNIPIPIIGFILTTTTVIQFGGSIFGGLYANKFGNKNALILGVLTRSFGYFLFIVTNNIIILCIALIVISIGTIFYMPASKSYINNVLYDNHILKAKLFAYQSSFGNIGMVLGLFVGTLLIKFNYIKILFIISSSILFILSLVQYKYLQYQPPIVTQKQDRNIFITLFSILSNAKLLIILVSYMAIFFIYMFFQNFMMLYITNYFDVSIYSYLIALNSVVLIIFSPVLSKYIAITNSNTTMFFGFICLGIGLFLFYTNTLWLLFVGIFILTIGETILFIKHDLLITDVLPNQVAIGISLLRMFAGFGILLNGIVATIYYNSLSIDNLMNFWLLPFAISLMFAIVFFVIYKYVFKNNL